MARCHISLTERKSSSFVWWMFHSAKWTLEMCRYFHMEKTKKIYPCLGLSQACIWKHQFFWNCSKSNHRPRWCSSLFAIDVWAHMHSCASFAAFMAPFSGQGWEDSNTNKPTKASSGLISQLSIINKWFILYASTQEHIIACGVNKYSLFLLWKKDNSILSSSWLDSYNGVRQRHLLSRRLLSHLSTRSVITSMESALHYITHRNHGLRWK